MTAGKRSDGNFRIPRPNTPLAFTGERMTSAAEGQIEFEHYHRYCVTRDLCRGRDVLDIAAGEGYGSALIAAVARSVVGVEIDPESVAHAQANYPAPNLRFLQGDALAIPLEDAAVDIVVSFETLEHLADHDVFVAEVRRVLRPNGLFVVSTPDRSVYSAPGADPNPYHVLELTDPEFRAFLHAHFVHVAVLAQRPILGSVLAAQHSGDWRSYERRNPDIIEATSGLARAHYLVAIASDDVLPDIGSSVYIDRRRVHDVVEDANRLPKSQALVEEYVGERNVAREEAARHGATIGPLQAELAHALEHARSLADEQAIGRSREEGVALQHHEELAARAEAMAGLELALAARTSALDALRDALAALQTELRAADDRLTTGQQAAAELARAHAAAVAERDAALAERTAATTGAAAEHARAEARLEGMQAELGRALKRQADLLQAAKTARQEASDAARQDAATAAQVQATLRAQIDAAEQALRTGTEQKADLARELGRARTELVVAAGVAQRLHRVQLERDALDQARAIAVAGREDARKRYEAILYSSSWQLLRPLHAIAKRHRRLARLLRRATKLIWWTLTFQLAHRYRLYRQWRAEAPARALAASRPAAQRLPQPQPQPQLQALPDAALAGPPVAAYAASKIAAMPAEAFAAASPAPVQTAVAAALPAPRDLRDAFRALNFQAAMFFPPVTAPVVSIVIPVYKGFSDLENCLRSLSATRGGEPDFEVILIDDCPAEPVLWAVPNSGGLVKIANEKNLGFLLTCNRAAAAARGRILCFLNSDTIVFPGWLSNLVSALDETPNAGLAGGMLLNVDGSIQEVGWRIMGNGWGHPIGRNGDARRGAYTYRRAVDCVTGACFVIPQRVFERLGGFDPIYAPAFYEEFDLAFRARALGLQVICEPKSIVVHLGSGSYGAERRDELSAVNHATFSDRFAQQLRKQPWDAADEFALRHGTEAGPVVLVVDYGVPQPDRHAGDVTMSRYLSLLATGGWRVVFCPMNGTAEGPAADALECQGIELIRAPQTITAWLEAHGEHVDHVWLARPEIAVVLLDPVRQLTRAPVAYYPHDLHHLRLQREAQLSGDAQLVRKAEQVRLQEHAVLCAVDLVTAPSDAEADAIHSFAPQTPITVLPAYFYEHSEIVRRDADHFLDLSDIVFVGGFPHTPNVDAAVFIARDIMPLVWRAKPQTRLILVGYAPPPEVLALAGPRVVVTGQVPHVEPFLARARLVLAALRFGAGVKGKIVDALRLGTPVVTTTVGAEGIGIEPGHDALVADDAEGLAGHVLTLLQDAGRCAALSAAGAALVERRFSRAAARTAIGTVFTTLRCAVCGAAELLKPQAGAGFRESFVCRNCFALARTEALARAVLHCVGTDGESSLAELARRRPKLRMHEFGTVGGIVETLQAQPWFSSSACVDTIAPGAAGPGGIRCEDLTRLSFSDASFQVLLGQDVLELVSDPAAAFAEVARVLAPGGAFFFTVPVEREMAQSERRAVLGPQGIEHCAPPEYRQDPNRPEGALVFTKFGCDLGQMVRAAGLELIERNMRVLGGAADQTVDVFEARRPPDVA